MDKGFIFNFLLYIFVLLVLTNYIMGQTCPNVNDCLETFTRAMSEMGHDQGEYCKQEHILLKCMEDAKCSDVTEEHKQNELRHFKHDGSCDGAAVSTITMSLLILANLVSVLLKQFLQ